MRFAAVFPCFLLLARLPAGATVPADDVARGIIGRALAPAPIMAARKELTRDIGGRTGSPGPRQAGQAGVDELREAGLPGARAQS